MVDQLMLPICSLEDLNNKERAGREILMFPPISLWGTSKSTHLALHYYLKAWIFIKTPKKCVDSIVEINYGRKKTVGFNPVARHLQLWNIKISFSHTYSNSKRSKIFKTNKFLEFLLNSWTLKHWNIDCE